MEMVQEEREQQLAVLVFGYFPFSMDSSGAAADNRLKKTKQNNTQKIHRIVSKKLLVKHCLPFNKIFSGRHFSKEKCKIQSVFTDIVGTLEVLDLIGLEQVLYVTYCHVVNNAGWFCCGEM